jgi:hypothetical protein
MFGNMSNDDTEELWCGSQRVAVTNYLRSQDVQHGEIGDWPAWHVTGCVAIWAIESVARPGWIGWWAISGDLPTDYCSAADIEPPQHPRKALRVLAERWLASAAAWENGLETPDFQIAGSPLNRELVPLLKSRAETLLGFASNDDLWELE